MNQFQFTITDNTQSPAVVTVIDEPVGWDGLEFKLARHNDWHGFFDYFDKDISMLEFDGVGFGILKEAYELVGVEAEVTLLIEFRCSETDTFEEIYEGNFDFLTYEQTCGDRCFIKINVNTTSCLVQFKNRYDQKVNIESLRTFDLPDGDANDLLPYAGIGFEMLLDPNKIELKSTWKTVNPTTDTYILRCEGVSENRYYFNPSMQSFENTIKDTIGGVFSHQEFPNFNNIGGSTEPVAWIDIETDQPTIYSNVRVKVRFSGSFEDNYWGGENARKYENTQAAEVTLWRESAWNLSATAIATVGTGIPAYGGGAGSSGSDYAYNFLAEMDVNIGTVAHGEKLFITFYFHKVTVDDTGHVDRELIFSLDNTSFVNIISDAYSEATNSKVSLINETASRVTEIITGDCLRVYSDYYGREDAEPYVSADDGCGSLRVLSNGLFIRRALQVDDTQPQHILSMKDMFEALNAIDCIGMGVEPDPNRPGYEMLRIERFQHFYDTTVLLTCTGVAKTERTIYMDGIFSTFKSGYQKFETETAGGRNDIHTHRNFRTTLKTIQKELVKICPFIASGHSIEITRWQVGNTSQDWRYDTDTFVICVVRNELYENGWQVDRGTDQTAVNLPNYDTVYNVQISPQRNARRWTPIVFQCYVDFANGVIKFMNGDGNLIAETFIYAEPSANDCGVELIDIGSQPNTPENSDIDYTKFNSTNKSDYYPIFKPERISFQYPLSYADWKIIKASPTGLIGFECNGTTEYGWIDELNYRPVEGMADFVLIPQQPDIIEEG